MDFFAGQDARRRHSMAYGNDEQHARHSAGCHAEKDAPKEVPLGCAVSCFDISESQY
jgi:hypothetical protein